MSALQRIVPKIPIKNFQLGAHLSNYKRDKKLTKAALETILQAGPVWFAVADVGYELQLVEVNQCVKFWKLAIEPHLADGPSRLEDFPDEYLYFASRWVAEGDRPIILLERQH